MTKPLRVSWSAIRVHGECHQKSFLMRTGKRPTVSNIRNFLHGSVVDKIMRDWLDNPLRQPGGMLDALDQAMNDVEEDAKQEGGIVRWRNAADRAELRQFCADLVTRLEPILRTHVLPYPFEAGKWFKVPINIPGLDGTPTEIVLTGEMDLIVFNDGPVIWDLKGTADDQYWRKVLGQLCFYDLAVAASSGQKSRFTGLIQPMCKEPLLTFEIDDLMRAQMLTRIIAYAHDVWRNEQTCKDGTAGCNYCDVRHACVRYQQPSLDVFGDLGAGLRQAAGEPT